MKNQKLNIVTEIFFLLILGLFLSYSVLLMVATDKIIPGFVMQIIFVLETIKFQNNIWQLLISEIFLTNMFGGVALAILIVSYIKGLANNIKTHLKTRKSISRYKVINQDKIKIINSGRNEVFTTGLFRPTIYISKHIYNNYSKEEIKSILLHEENHKNNFHPLKVFIASITKDSLWIVPGRRWIYDNFVTITEVASDAYAEKITQDKKSLVTALLKFQQNLSLGPSVSYFNSQSERIKVLVGKKRIMIGTPLMVGLTLALTLVGSSNIVKKSEIFFDCRHLLKCVELLVKPDSQPILSLSTSQNSSQEIPVENVSNHCE